VLDEEDGSYIMKPSRTARQLLGESIRPLTPDETPERWGGNMKTPPYYDPAQPELQANPEKPPRDPAKNEVRMVEVKQRPVDFEVCPHCQQEIYERHTYTDEDGTERHSDCDGAIKRPEPTNVPDWLKPFMHKSNG
jgi:hypothetical protein